MRISLLFVGFGRVAARFVTLLDESRDALRALDIDPVIDGIATRHHGCWTSASGIAAGDAIAQLHAGKYLGPPASSIVEWIHAHAPAPGTVLVLIETTTLDIESGESAISHVRAGFASGRHVITANKGPVAFAYSALAAEAASAGLQFLFEGAVMDGIPIFNLVRETCPGVTVRGFRGVVNSTTNEILSALERGESFEPALRRMQDAGIAEADPSLDVDGWDAAAKTAALANVWLGARTTPRDVPREGLNETTSGRARAALASGRRLKLVAWARRDDADVVRSGVELQELQSDDPLAMLDGQANAIELDTWPLGRITIGQRDGGLEKTAYALFADLVTVRRSLDLTAQRPKFASVSAAPARAASAAPAPSSGAADIPSPRGPLTGLTILDLTRVLAGPFCTMLAADMGARVIKIEHPGRGDDTRAWGPPFAEGESAYYLSVNRNKESVALDFQSSEGREVLEKLIARADVLVENFRPGTLDRHGFGYEALAARHPRLVYVSISGFGRNGPRRDEPGYDAVAQAESGLMSITGQADGPAVRLGVAIADIAAGMYAFQGLLLALLARQQTGRGQLVDVALLDAATSLLTYQASRFFMTGDSPTRSGNRHQTIAPYDTFDAADGVLVLAVGNDDQWRRFCRTLSLDAALADERLATNEGRVVRYDEVRAIVARAVATVPVDTLVARLREAGVPCGAVRSVEDALSDPQIAARTMIEAVDHPAIGALTLLGIPVKLSETPGGVRLPPPRLGEHTRSVLCDELGISPADLEQWARRRIVRS